MKIRNAIFLSIIYLSFIFNGSAVAYAQDSTIAVTIKRKLDLQSNPTIKYWEKGAYSAYPKDTNTPKVTTSLAYSSVKKKYHSPAFDYTDKKYKKSSFWQRVGTWIGDFFKSMTPDWRLNFTQIVIYLLYALGGFSILFIAFRIFYNKNSIFSHDPEKKEEEEVEFVKRHLENIDLQSYIDKSLTDENWNMAIRYLQLQLLQLLAQKGQIEWDYRKTNQDFIYEIKDKNIKEKFIHTTTVFNYVWYGDFELDKAKFEVFKADFMQLKNELS